MKMTSDRNPSVNAGAVRVVRAVGATLLGSLLMLAGRTSPAAGLKDRGIRPAPEVGVASWYGRTFQGKRTAMGEPFDMNVMTCAHRTLPLGSWLRVTNLRNRRSIFVRVNDRGPHIGNRIVDLSYAAARALGMSGLGRVRLDPVRADGAAMSMVSAVR